mmetsp:Transcript_76339/g.168629  ORF Transcript_76339/g.168629 Transcript_76339/m.168629 type:complete len:202 (-) Transcript_76339:294-899(-)
MLRARCSTSCGPLKSISGPSRPSPSAPEASFCCAFWDTGNTFKSVALLICPFVQSSFQISSKRNAARAGLANPQSMKGSLSAETSGAPTLPHSHSLKRILTETSSAMSEASVCASHAFVQRSMSNRVFRDPSSLYGLTDRRSFSTSASFISFAVAKSASSQIPGPNCEFRSTLTLKSTCSAGYSQGVTLKHSRPIFITLRE